jgi:F0F1-type ATP synthase gamma subunit
VNRRRNSIKSVAAITNTMKLVAQAKLNTAKLRAEKSTPFFRSAGSIG